MISFCNDWLSIRTSCYKLIHAKIKAKSNIYKGREKKAYFSYPHFNSTFSHLTAHTSEFLNLNCYKAHFNFLEYWNGSRTNLGYPQWGVTKKDAHSHPKTKILRKTPPGSDLQQEILPQWQSASKWDLKGVQPGSTHFSHKWIAFTCTSRADQILFQVLNQWFCLRLSSSHTSA